MIDLIKSRINHGNQAIMDIKKAVINEKFTGMPVINKNKPKELIKCRAVCQTGAINGENMTIDLGKCIFCRDCERLFGDEVIRFTNFHKMSATSREKLIIGPDTTIDGFEKNAVIVNKKIRGLFGRSLKLRSVSAGGCNACELELNASLNVNFDMGRFGIEVTASPRHADGIIITGPISENMVFALEETYLAIPDPKIVILAGTCAISGGLFAGSKAISREFLDKYRIDLYVPGCPFHPLTLINGILGLLGI